MIYTKISLNKYLKMKLIKYNKINNHVTLMIQVGYNNWVKYKVNN